MSAPRILVDALSMREGGGRSYVTNLLREIARDDRGMRFSFLALPGQLDDLDTSGVDVEVLHLPAGLGGARVPLRVLYEMVGLPWRARRFDLLYCIADLSPPFASTPTVVLLRNLNVYDRRYYDDLRTRTLARLAVWGARRARRLLFPSRAAADWICGLAPLPRDRVEVVHYGIDLEAFAAGDPVQAERPYLFLPAAPERHKNIEILIRGLPLLQDGDVELWLAGRSMLDADHATALLDLAEELGVRERIRLLGPVPYAELLGYYRGALALAFPSFLETFGHPVLEAMVAGTPLVLSDIPTFREIAGDAALYFDADDPRDFARCVDRLASDPEGARARVASGHRRAEAFSWRASVDALCRVFEETLEEARR